MIELAKKYFKIHRSITGKGVRKSLKLLKQEIPNLRIKKIKSGNKVFDWKIPAEWNIKEAYIADKNAKKIIDFKNNNLHIINYSTSINKFLSRQKLLKHLFFEKSKPNAIPYMTSYYKKFWGFCVSYNDFKSKFNQKKYKVVINSKFNKKGFLNYGELIIKGKSKKEIIIHTYICHPGLANNETSGPIVCTYLAKYFQKKKNNYTLRFIFTPETIGSIAYIYKNYKSLKDNVIGGYVITCVGDEKNYSICESKEKQSLSNKIAKEVFAKNKIKFKAFSYLERGSDERQYNSPGIDLSIASIMRTKHGEFKEYHTSDDNFNLVTKIGLIGSFKIIKKIISEFDKKIIPFAKFKCEPFMTKRNLYDSLSSGRVDNYTRDLMNFLAYSDGTKDIKEIGKIINVNNEKIKKIYNILKINRLVN